MLARHHGSRADEMVGRRTSLTVTCLAMRQTVRAQQLVQTDVNWGRLTLRCLRGDTTALANDSTRIRHLSYLCQSLASDPLMIAGCHLAERARRLLFDSTAPSESYVGRKSGDWSLSPMRLHHPRQNPLLER